ncbi:MAG: hypothetical protein ABIK15_14330 [Pseudomonadota bacterium]
MITADELRVLNHIIEDMEDHPECNQLSPEEMDNILEEYNQVNIREQCYRNIRSF